MSDVMRKHVLLFVLFFLFMFTNSLYAQKNQAVKWAYKLERLSANEVLLTIIANIAPRWHLYSQFLQPGGPQPTSFTFDHSKEYSVAFKTEEKGQMKTYYDDTYEMDITSYSGTITFLQKIEVHQPMTFIKGKVEYMACNDEICVPDKWEFAIPVNLLRRNP